MKLLSALFIVLLALPYLAYAQDDSSIKPLPY